MILPVTLVEILSENTAADVIKVPSYVEENDKSIIIPDPVRLMFCLVAQ